MKWRWYVLIAAASFLANLILRAPVATLHAWFAPQEPPPTLELFGLQGSLLEGRLAGLSDSGRLRVSDVHWRLKPGWLLLARTRFQLDGGGELATLAGALTLVPGGRVQLNDFRVNGNIKSLLATGGYPFLPVDGTGAVEIDRLKLKDGVPTQAQAHAEVRGLAWTLARDPMTLGDFQADVQTRDGTITAAIGTIAGPLSVSGEARLQPDKTYELHLQLKAKPEADPNLQNLIRSIGQPDTQGYYHIRRKGSLP